MTTTTMRERSRDQGFEQGWRELRDELLAVARERFDQVEDRRHHLDRNPPGAWPSIVNRQRSGLRKGETP